MFYTLLCIHMSFSAALQHWGELRESLDVFEDAAENQGLIELVNSNGSCLVLRGRLAVMWRWGHWSGVLLHGNGFAVRFLALVTAGYTSVTALQLNVVTGHNIGWSNRAGAHFRSSTSLRTRFVVNRLHSPPPLTLAIMSIQTPVWHR